MAKNEVVLKKYEKYFNNFYNNLWELASFLGTTEKYYNKQVKKMEGQILKAQNELHDVEKMLEELSEKEDNHKLTKTEKEKLIEFSDKAYDLTDIIIFTPIDMNQFRMYPELLRVLGLSYLVAIFEGYLVDIVRELLKYTESLKSPKQCSVETIVDFNKQPRIKNYSAEKEMKKFLYKPFPEVTKYFNTKFDINLVDSGITTMNITEIMATRNIHVHNRGYVDQQYIQTTKGMKMKIGDYKKITKKYLKDSISSVYSLVKFIDSKVQERICSNSFPD